MFKENMIIKNIFFQIIDSPSIYMAWVSFTQNISFFNGRYIHFIFFIDFNF